MLKRDQVKRGYTLAMGAQGLPLELDRSLKEYRRLLESEFGPRLRSLRLFGSQARGDADTDSDADVSVVIEGLTEAERARVIDLALPAWLNAGSRGPFLSALPWSEAEREKRRSLERRIALDIERDGISV